MTEIIAEVNMVPSQAELEKVRRRDVVEGIIITAIENGIDSVTTICNLIASTLGDAATFEYARWSIYELKKQGMIEITNKFTVQLTDKSDEYLVYGSPGTKYIDELVDSAAQTEQIKRQIGGKLLELIYSPAPVTESSNLEP